MVEDTPLLPMGWMILAADLPHRPPPITPGLTGAKPPQTGWLSPLKAVVRLVTAFQRRTRRVVAPAPLLSAVNWLRARLTLYDRGELNSRPRLGGGALLMATLEGTVADRGC